MTSPRYPSPPAPLPCEGEGSRLSVFPSPYEGARQEVRGVWEQGLIVGLAVLLAVALVAQPAYGQEMDGRAGGTRARHHHVAG